MSAAVASYDAARRAWRRAPGTPAKWPRAGSLRGGRVIEAPPVGRDASALRVTHYRWPTLLRTDGEGRCARNTNARYKHFSNLFTGYVWPAWAEWLMGLAAGWTKR